MCVLLFSVFSTRFDAFLQDYQRLAQIPPFPGLEELPEELIPQRSPSTSTHPPLLHLGFPLNALNIPRLVNKSKRRGCLRLDGERLDLFGTVSAMIKHWAEEFELDLDFCGVHGQPGSESPEFFLWETSTWFISVWTNYDCKGSFSIPDQIAERTLNFSGELYGDDRDHVPDWCLDFQWVPGSRISRVD